jgi:c-di-GMP-binding flagellar brake protein YcgR
MPNDLIQNPNPALFNNPVDEKTKTAILRTLIASKSSVKIQMDDKTFESTIFTTTDINKIAVNCANSGPQLAFKTGQEMACYFSIKNEFYFFTSKTTYTDIALIFSTPQIMYNVQRRDNFRVYVPNNMNQKVELVGYTLRMNLTDLSLGGCRVKVYYSESSQLTSFKAGTETDLCMTFLNFDNQIVHCKVKFLREDLKTKTAIIGLKFEKLKAEEIQEIQAAIFKIDRLNRCVEA